MTKEEFIRKLHRTEAAYSELSNDLDALIASELAKATKPNISYQAPSELPEMSDDEIDGASAIHYGTNFRSVYKNGLRHYRDWLRSKGFNKPKPPFEKPFSVNCDKPFDDRFQRIFDANDKLIGWADCNLLAAEYICSALNQYEGE